MELYLFAVQLTLKASPWSSAIDATLASVVMPHSPLQAGKMPSCFFPSILVVFTLQGDEVKREGKCGAFGNR